MTGKSAGLYLVAEYLGYWNGSAFAAYIDHSGNFRFGSGSGSAKLEYSASAGKLRGVNTGGTEQWYASATDGKIYAGAGNVYMDATGLWLKSPIPMDFGSFSSVNFYGVSPAAEIAIIGGTATSTDDTLQFHLSRTGATTQRFQFYMKGSMKAYIDPDGVNADNMLNVRSTAF